jgi:hypothetical protein
VTLVTVGGDCYDFHLSAEASVLDGKHQAFADIGRPSELQRWFLDGSILEDTEVLSSYRITEPMRVHCVFLPRTFDVNVKVVKFSPGSQAESVGEVSVTVSPNMFIDAAKGEALFATFGSDCPQWHATRLIKGGRHLHDDKTVEHYHIDPDSTLHLVIPRGRGDSKPSPNCEVLEGAGVQFNSSENYELDGDAARQAELFFEVSNSDDIVKSGKTAEGDFIKACSKETLSPRAKEAALMFNTMGRFPLRPRSLSRSRTASMPAMARPTSEASSEGTMTSALEAQSALVASCEALVTDRCTPSERPSDSPVSNSTAPTWSHSQPVVGQIMNGNASLRSEVPHQPPRGRRSSRCASPRIRRSLHGNTETCPANSSGPASPALKRPPRMPKTSPVTTAKGGDQKRPDLERPSSSSHGIASPSKQPPQVAESWLGEVQAPWVRQWAAASQANSTSCSGDVSADQVPSQWGMQRKYGLRGFVSTEAITLKRSASCRAAGIDRWHHARRQI